jgi:uncharacterized protein
MGIKIRRLSTSGGYLEQAPIDFPNGLTCIIGARGTCKSTIVETIRFVFDSNKQRIREMAASDHAGPRDAPPHHGLLAATLAGASARCDVGDEKSDVQLSLERDIGSDPRIYRDTLISGSLWDGPSALLLEAVARCEATILMSPGLLAEFFEVISRPKFAERITRRGTSPVALARKLADEVTLVTPADLRLPPDLRDPKDLPIPACAVGAHVDAIVTGDKDLLPWARSKTFRSSTRRKRCVCCARGRARKGSGGHGGHGPGMGGMDY